MPTLRRRLAQLIAVLPLLAGAAGAQTDKTPGPVPDCSLLDGREILLSPSTFPDIPPFDKKTVELELRVMPDGSVRDTKVVRSSSFPELDAKAIKEAQQRGCKALPQGSPPDGVPTRVRMDVWRVSQDEFFHRRPTGGLSIPWSLPRRYDKAYGPIPYDKAYEELDPRQKAIVRASYENLGENDEPPYPKEGLGKVIDVMIAVQKKALVKGEMDLIVRIDEHGKPLSVAVYKTPDPKVSNLAGSALMLLDYKPGVCADRPCAMDYRVDIDFEVR